MLLPPAMSTPTTEPTESHPSVGRRVVSGFRAVRRKIAEILQQDVWDIEIGALPGLRRTFVRSIRVFQLVLRGFRNDECMLHASSLTFITLLAFVPVLAIALSMARVFGGGDLARDQLKSLAREYLPALSAPAAMPGESSSLSTPETPVPDTPGSGTKPDDAFFPQRPDTAVPDALDPNTLNPEPTPPAATAPSSPEPAISIERMEKMIDTGFERINSLNFSALGGIGLVLLLWTVISVLGQVESAFNRVWGVTEHRTLQRKFTDYLSVVIVVPFLITAASTIPAANYAARLMQGDGMPIALPLLGRALRLAGTLLLLTLSFSFVLRFLPNTRVRLRPALAGGFATAALSLGWLRLCTAFQIGVARNSAFFGGFATVPVLLSWVYVSWEILLFGAEVAFAVQNADTFHMEMGATRASVRTRLLVAVDLLAESAKSISKGDGLLRITDYVAEHRISVRLVNDVVSELVLRKFLVETAEDPGVFAVRRDVLGMPVSEVVLAFLDSGVTSASLGVRFPRESVLRDPFDAALTSILPQKIGHA